MVFGGGVIEIVPFIEYLLCISCSIIPISNRREPQWQGGGIQILNPRHHQQFPNFLQSEAADPFCHIGKLCLELNIQKKPKLVESGSEHLIQLLSLAFSPLTLRFRSSEASVEYPYENRCISSYCCPLSLVNSG